MVRVPYLLMIIGAFFGGLSIFAMFHDIYEFGISKLIEKLIAFFDVYIGRSIEFIFSFLPFSIPYWVQCVIVVYLILVSVAFRAFLINLPASSDDLDPAILAANAIPRYTSALISSLIWPVSLVIAVRRAKMYALYAENGYEDAFEYLAFSVGYPLAIILQTIMIFIALGIFFALNYLFV